MKTLKHAIVTSAIALAVTTGPAAHAQSPSAVGGSTPSSSSAGAASEMTEGQVRKVDKANKKLTLKHGPIKNLDMPGMTMVFQVSDPAMLEKVQPGDKVLFKASGDGGKFTVTDLQPAP